MTEGDEVRRGRDDWPSALSRDVLAMSANIPPWRVQDKGARRRLWEILPVRTHFKEFCSACRDIAVWYAFTIALLERDRPKEIKDDLQRISKQQKMSLRSLELLSETGHRSLEDVASSASSKDRPWRDLEPPHLSFPMGRSRVDLAVQLVDELRGWVEGAAEILEDAHAKQTAARPRGGRPPMDAEREAVEAVLQVWFDQGNVPPKAYPNSVSKQYEQPFVEFCRGVILPVSKLVRGTEPNLGPLIKEVLASPAE